MPRGADIKIGKKRKGLRAEPPPVLSPEVRAAQLKVIREKTPFNATTGGVLLVPGYADLLDETPDDVLAAIPRDNVSADALRKAREPVFRLFTGLYDSLDACATRAGVSGEELNRVLSGQQEALDEEAIAALCEMLRRDRHGRYTLRALRRPKDWPILHVFREPT